MANNALQTFADRMGCSGKPQQQVRAELEASLIPLVRRVLRSGAGMPELVQWVQTTLPQVHTGQDRTRPVDLDRVAPPLARLLCATLLRQIPTRPTAVAADTVLGR